MPTQDEFLAEVDRYIEVAGIGAATLGKRALNDPNFVSDLRGGRSPSLAIVDRVRKFIADNPPAAAPAKDAADPKASAA